MPAFTTICQLIKMISGLMQFASSQRNRRKAHCLFQSPV